MILLERIGLAATVLEAVLKCHFPTILASTVSVAGRGGKEPCQYTKYARSGGVADAVREHSFCSAPTRSEEVTLERSALPFFVPLTPARWGAMSLVAAFLGADRVRGAVPVRTVPEPRQNHQLTEIASLSSLVLWFQLGASRHACAHTHVGPCAYMCARKARTSEPANNIYVIQMDRGSDAVLERFQPELAPLGAGRAQGFAPISNILIGRYAPAALDRARRGLMRSRGGERFGVFGRSAWALRPSAATSTRRARIGGNAWVFGAASSVVGTPMLERMAQTRGNACFFEADHLPSGKARGTPPCPLSRSQPPRWRWRSSVPDFGSAFGLIDIQAPCVPSKNWREVDFAGRGRGKLRRAANPARKPGRGVRDAAEMLRRMPCMGGGIDRVK